MAAAVVLLLPASYELFGSITYSQWYLALYLLFGAFAWPAAGPWRWPDRLCLAVVSLTGPFSIFAAPLYWLRRDLRTSAVIVTAGAFVQLSTGFSAPRVAFLQVPDDLLGIVAGRLVLEPLLGELIVAFVPLFAALILVIPLVLCLRSVPISLVLATIAIAAAGVLYSPTTSAVLLQPWGAQRYFFLSGAVIAFAIVLSAARGERAGRLLGPLLVLAVLIDFRIPWR